MPSLFPENGVKISGAFIGVDRFWMAGTAIVIALLLWVGFRFTRLGLATQATSQNEKGASLLGLRAEHPDVRRVQNMLDRLGLDLPLQRGAAPALIATISSPKGRVELRN